MQPKNYVKTISKFTLGTQKIRQKTKNEGNHCTCLEIQHLNSQESNILNFDLLKVLSIELSQIIYLVYKTDAAQEHVLVMMLLYIFFTSEVLWL